LYIKRPILLAPTLAALLCPDSIHSPNICQPFSPDSKHSPDIRQPFPRTQYIRSRSTFAIFEKNVTRLETFAQEIRHFGEFGASGHCLVNLQNFDFPKKQLSTGPLSFHLVKKKRRCICYCA
jgi:hypothetical protein